MTVLGLANLLDAQEKARECWKQYPKEELRAVERFRQWWWREKDRSFRVSVGELLFPDQRVYPVESVYEALLIMGGGEVDDGREERSGDVRGVHPEGD